MAIYMKVPGVDGNVTAEGFAKWINLDSLQFGTGRAISMEVGNLSNREATKPNISEITVSKETDGASSGLLNESLVGAKGKKIELVVVKTGAKAVEEVLRYTLGDALISAFSMSSGAEGMPHESISVSFGHLEVSFTAHKDTGDVANVERVAYDLATAKPG